MPTVSFDPEPGVPSSVPQGAFTPKQRGDLIIRLIQAHHRLRQKSFWDTGRLIEELLGLRAEYRAANIKELCAKADLGISHMTANKYLRVARTFAREMAVEIGIEKCYALILFAKTIGKAQEAVAIWEQDRPIHGAKRGVTAKSATAKQIYEAVKLLKAGKKRRETPPEVTAKIEADVSKIELLFKKLSLPVQAEPGSRGGEPGYFMWISEKTVSALEPRLAKGLAKVATHFSKHQPDLIEPLRVAGWAPKRAPKVPLVRPEGRTG